MLGHPGGVAEWSVTARIPQVLAEGLAGLGLGLGLVGIAEGVETEEQARILAAQGWPRGQGWLFGRPLPEPLGP